MKAVGDITRRAQRVLGMTWIAAIAGLSQHAQAEDTFCKVEAVFGLAEIVTEETRSPLEDGSPVDVQDRIETGDESRVTLLCPEDLRISP